MNNLSDIIYFHRKKAGLSRIQLAQLACVGKTVIYDLEKGKQSIRWDIIQAILQTLNITIELQSPLMELYEKSKNTNT
ncbi:MAG: helix-turn-helix domain-containing protein [Planctomycetia bacterium]|nr:helix-turn-helix domain-containing protein [Planctomycetia bacterium]